MIGVLLSFSHQERLEEKLFEMFENDFKTFQHVQKYPLRRAVREESLREDKFVKILHENFS